MKLLHPVDNRNQKGFTDDEKQESQIAIYQNIMESIVSLLDAMQGKLETQNIYNDYIGNSMIVELAQTQHLQRDALRHDTTIFNKRNPKIFGATIFLKNELGIVICSSFYYLSDR